MNPRSNDIGAYLTLQGNVKPQSLSGTTAVNGTGLDRQGFGSAKVEAQVGDATGSPTSYTVIAKLQDSADNSTFADVSGATVTLDADGESLSFDVDLRTLDRYIRVVLTPAFVGGTSPTVPASATIALGGANILPAAAN